jgi:Kef-type K+ transport system membrane component KefB
VTVLQIVLAAIAAVVAVWLVVLVVRDTEPDDYLYAALALLEVGMLVQLVVGLVQVSGDHGEVNVAAYVGYLVGSAVLLPVAFVWSAGERTRAGTGVLLVAVLVVPVLFVRLHQLWGAR